MTKTEMLLCLYYMHKNISNLVFARENRLFNKVVSTELSFRTHCKLSSHVSQETLLQYPWVSTVLVMRTMALIVHCSLERYHSVP